jgi:hypothetical protein
MSPASTDAASPVSRPALRALGQLLHARREGWLLEKRLARAAATIARDAREQGLPPERMLVALKEAWATLDGVRELPRRDAQDVLNRVGTLSIRAYFERGGASGRGAGGSSGESARPAA